MDVYPLIFEPIFKPKIWGGRRLASVLSKSLPPDEPIGESWELADLEDDQSIVANGPAKGQTLGELVGQWGDDLTGSAPLFEGRFPLLLKFLDASDTLSVQVHPDEATAKRLGGLIRVKNEAWYVVDATEDGFIYRGVKAGVEAADLERTITNGDVESVLNRISVRKGHCYYLPSGTIHALGAGVLVAEVQTPSDITYRVYDWNRVDPSTGFTRTLHVDEALGCINYDTGAIAGEVTHHTASVWTAVTGLVRCDSFLVDRVRMVEGVDQEIPIDGLMAWMLLEGRCSISGGGLSAALTVERGATVLFPAGTIGARVRTEASTMWLQVSVPMPSNLADLSGADREALRKTINGGGDFVQLGGVGG